MLMPNISWPTFPDSTMDVDDKKDNEPRSSKRLCFCGLFMMFVVMTVVLVPIGVSFLRPDIARKSSISKSKLPAKVQLNHTTTTSQSSEPSSSSEDTDQQVLLLDDFLDQEALAAENLAGTIFDIRTWLDLKDFNLTFTKDTVRGLPIMGINSSWDDTPSATEFVPPLNDAWDYGERPVRGVNIAGWLCTDPSITKSLYGASTSEEELTTKLRNTGGWDAAKHALETHYSTFITEEDFKMISASGIDHIRISVGYWLVDVLDDGHLPHVGWRYLLRGLEWARRYGLRVQLVIENSTLEDSIKESFCLDTHSRLGTFFSQPRYKNLVVQYGLGNVPDALLHSAYAAVQTGGYTNSIVYSAEKANLNEYCDRFPVQEYPNMVLSFDKYMGSVRSPQNFTRQEKLRSVCENWSSEIGELASSELENRTNVLINGWWMIDTCSPAQHASGLSVDDHLIRNHQAYRVFLKDFVKSQMAVFEKSGGQGWYYWTWKTETEDIWTFKEGIKNGIIPILQQANDPDLVCSFDFDYREIGLAR